MVAIRKDTKYKGKTIAELERKLGEEIKARKELEKRFEALKVKETEIEEDYLKQLNKKE